MTFLSYEDINKLNNKEFRVYNLIVNNMEYVQKMSIRELAFESKVSTTTILRFCEKVGCKGYTEFKYKLKKFIEYKQGNNACIIQGTVPAIQFLQKSIKNNELKEKLERVSEICINSRRVIFYGVGSSGCLSEYGAYIMSSTGLDSSSITDLFYPLPNIIAKDVTMIILSVSGNTETLIKKLDIFRNKGIKIISITNTDQCTIANMSDINFSYYMPLVYSLQEDGIQTALTTQIPVVYLLESIVGIIHKKLNK